MADELTPEEIEANRVKAEQEQTQREEEFQAELEKRFGTRQDGLIKKTEQVKVLSEAEKLELEEKKNSEALTTALSNGWVKKTDYDSFLSATATDRVQIARQQFIDDHKELGDKAGAKFDKIYMLDAEDEIEVGEGENAKFVPNEDKKIALAYAAKIGEDIINNKYAPIKNLPQRHENHLKQVALEESNKQLITKAVSEVPREIEYNIPGTDRKYSFKFSDKDVKEAEEMTLRDLARSKDLKPEDIKLAAGVFLQSKNIAKIVKEIDEVAYQRGVDETERGKSGIVPDRGAAAGNASAMTEFAKKMNLIPK